MISREALLHQLKENRDKEDKALPLYAQHLSNAMFLSSALEADQHKIKEILQTLSEDSQRHRQMYQAMIDRIEREGKDVY